MCMHVIVFHALTCMHEFITRESKFLSCDIYLTGLQKLRLHYAESIGALHARMVQAVKYRNRF
jgi:hypothetical protein